MFSNHVTIGPEFFAKAFNDYSNWRWALAREFGQNSMDCGSGEIRVTLSLNEMLDTVVTVENNGDPMTREILQTKLLALGGSGKNFQGTVGGFGKAKEILYFAHKSYKIETGNLVVTGSGAGYNIDENGSFDGTRSTVVLSGDHLERLTHAFRTFASYSQWDGVLYLNGERMVTNLKKGSPRRDLGFGTVYTNKSFPNKLIVRINGIPMFHEYISLDRCVIVELNGASVDVLTSNRDGLNSSCRHELSSFITELAVNKRSALKQRGLTKYRRYEGKKLRHRVQSAVNVKALVVGGEPKERGGVAALVNVVGRTDLVPTSGGGGGGGTITMGGAVIQTIDVVGECGPQAADYRQTVEENVIFRNTNVSEEFIIKNETDLQVPSYYLPDSTDFSTYSQKLVKMWGRLLVELHRLFEHEADFALGFIFDESAEAEFEKGEYGKVYYLNPAKVVEQSSSASKSFKKRFQLTERNRLLMIALHEFVHGMGYGPHDEDYANRLTDMSWKVLDERKRFNWCFA